MEEIKPVNEERLMQAKKWQGGFGKEYTDRNPQSAEDVDGLYMKNFGVSRTTLNEEFLEDIPKSITILEQGAK